MNNSKLTSIGLNKEKSKELADSPNDLLSNYSIFYQNSKGYQWNIQEDKFFELHVKFEELYNDLFLKIDEIAERIIILSYKPNHKFSDYSKTATIKESINKNAKYFFTKGKLDESWKDYDNRGKM